MLDSRIYRTGLVLVGLAVVVLAFSLRNQPAGLSSSLAPDAFSGQSVYSNMLSLSAAYPDRRPGSNGDRDLAAQVQQSFRKPGRYGFAVSTDTFAGRTADGTRTLENVLAVRPGIQSGSIVVVAPRDARGSPATATLSGTATLIELARDLSGETLNRTVVLASTSGTQGQAGAIRLASTLSGPIDAVIVLGDLASARVTQPIVVPWSGTTKVAPPQLGNTLAAALGLQANLPVGEAGLGGQFAHLAFPLTVSTQGPFAAQGTPAVELSLSGERGPAADAALGSPDRLNSVGRSVLSTISALDGGSSLPRAAPYLLLSGKVVPGWAISLFTLALILPVLMTTIDGAARARRRGHALWRWIAMVLAAALPFALVALIVLAAHGAGLLPTAPPGPVPAGSIPPPSAATVLLGVAGVTALLALALLGGLVRRLGRRDPFRAGAPPALLVVLVLVTAAIWTANPFAALLLAPALHLWLPAVNTELRVPVMIRLLLVLAGLLPVALVVLYYAASLGYDPLQAAWTAGLLIAGGAVSPVAVLQWSVVLGCLLGATTLAALTARAPRSDPARVTVRGPITYAGPGSLGGTESALRR